MTPLTAVRAAKPSAPPIDVILWFDTEDYLSPSDDDAAKRLAQLLSARQIRATFKVVGEKARVLEQRHRTDVIDALKRHDIGFHGNFHSVHPTVSEYEATAGLQDGMEEFVRREGVGAADVRRIFGRESLVCYGQPGSSFAAQAIAALRACKIENDGVPCYLDSGQHVGVGGTPFWYAGALVVYKMRPNETRMELFTPDGLEQGEKQFADIARQLRGSGGGLISIFYHPCEWVTSEFWDGVNFSRGANPPRDQWKLPAQRPAEQTQAAFGRFEQYIDFIREQPGVHFVTASQLPAIYSDSLRTRGATINQITELARRISAPDSPGLDDLTIQGMTFSPADQLFLLASTLSIAKNPAGALTIAPLSLLGPDSPPPNPDPEPIPVSWPAFTQAVLDLSDYIKSNQRIPSQIFIGSHRVSPADFTVALARAFLESRDPAHLPTSVLPGKGVKVLTERFVAREDGRLFSGWVIHPTAFQAPHIMDIARLQAWTIKPAVRIAATPAPQNP
ncbi:MAG TPA: hypothetical protein VIM11_16950 [Tepidisphaeraceae bacterium]